MMDIVDIYFTSAITHQTMPISTDTADFVMIGEWAIEEDNWQALHDATYDATHRCCVNPLDASIGVYTVFAREREETPMEAWLREGREEMLECERSTLPR